MLFHSSRFVLFAALVTAALATGCMDSQRSQAKSGCEARYIGRQKAACEMGVNIAYDKARTEDGVSVSKKYKGAVARCGQLEKPLVAPCMAGVDGFRDALARSDSPKAELAQQTRRKSKKVASRAAASKSRAPASVGDAQPVPAQ